jgi:hypothetical protein
LNQSACIASLGASNRNPNRSGLVELQTASELSSDQATASDIDGIDPVGDRDQRGID